MLFLDAGGYPLLHGAAVVAAATIAIERGLITKGRRDDEGQGSEVVHLDFDTPAGTVLAHVETLQVQAGLRVRSVRLTGVPSFVAYAGLEVRLGSRRLRADLAYGGVFYAIVDSEAAGIPLVPGRLGDIRKLGVEICSVLEGHGALVHPDGPDRAGIGGAVFTGPPQSSDAHLRSVLISSDGGCDRSPGMTSAAAIMAVLNAMGLLQEGDDFVHEGLLGLPERGRVVRSALVGSMPAIVPEMTGAAWITGEHTLIVDGDDPLRDGFSL
jgi:proline racemase